MVSVDPSTAPFLFSIFLAVISPLTTRLWKNEMRSDAKEMEDEGTISCDITKEFVNITEKIVGTIQMLTALSITTISGGVLISQSYGNNQLATRVNLLLFVVSGVLLYRLFSRDPSVYSLFGGFPVTRSAVYTFLINSLFLLAIYLI